MEILSGQALQIGGIPLAPYMSFDGRIGSSNSCKRRGYGQALAVQMEAFEKVSYTPAGADLQVPTGPRPEPFQTPE